MSVSCRVVRTIKEVSQVFPGPRHICFGTFDGLHKGHQALIRRCLEHRAREGGHALMVSLYPTPRAVLDKTKDETVLTTLRERALLLGAWGIDGLVLVHFTDSLSKKSAETFVHDYFIEGMKISTLVIGEDAAVGKGREGGSTFLTSYLPPKGIAVEMVSFLQENDTKIGSRRIHKMIQEGDLRGVQSSLGRPYGIVGKVRKGAQRGRTLDYPTINFIPHSKVLPPLGVYVTTVQFQGRSFPAVSNLGIRPTLNDGGVTPILETHIFDTSPGEIPTYGSRIAVHFHSFLRGEQKFENLDQLKAQIARDTAQAVQVHKTLDTSAPLLTPL